MKNECIFGYPYMCYSDTMKGIIAGTGVDKIQKIRTNLSSIETKYGVVEYYLYKGVVIIPRHSKDHSLPPHRINYLANIEALDRLGVDSVVGIYCVGSITDKVGMGEYGILSDYMDFSGRNITFFNDEVKHTSVSHPFDKSLSLKLKKALPVAKEDVVYVTTNGPRFETGAEIKAYKILGGDVVGMTGGSEMTLILEKGIKMAALCYSINWCTGVKEEFGFSEEGDMKTMSQKTLFAALEAQIG